MTEIIPALEPLPPAGGGPRQWLLPGGLALVLLAIVATVLILAQRAGETGAPSKPEAFEPPREALEVVVYDVQGVSGARITFAADLESTDDLVIPDAARVERLTAMDFADVQVGDWATVIGVVNGVRNYTIGSVVIMDGSRATAGGTELRSPGGFLGYEADRDLQQRVIIAGLVETVEDGRFTITTPGGPVAVSLEDTEGAGPPPFLRLDDSSIAEVRTGDRVAFPATPDGKPDPAATAVLVLDAAAVGAPDAPSGAGGGTAPTQ